MDRLIPVAFALAVFSCSSRGGSPDASVAVSVPPSQPATVLPPATGAPPNQLRRPAWDRATMENAIRVYERSNGQAPPTPPSQP